MLYADYYREVLALEHSLICYDAVVQGDFQDSPLVAHQYIAERLGLNPETFATRIRSLLRSALTPEEYDAISLYYGLDGSSPIFAAVLTATANSTPPTSIDPAQPSATTPTDPTSTNAATPTQPAAVDPAIAQAWRRAFDRIRERNLFSFQNLTQPIYQTPPLFDSLNASQSSSNHAPQNSISPSHPENLGHTLTASPVMPSPSSRPLTLNHSIDCLDLPALVRNSIYREASDRIKTIGDLIDAIEYGQFGHIRHIGGGSVYRTIEELIKQGFIADTRRKFLVDKNCR